MLAVLRLNGTQTGRRARRCVPPDRIADTQERECRVEQLVDVVRARS